MKCLADTDHAVDVTASQPEGNKGFLQDVQRGIPTFLKKKKLPTFGGEGGCCGVSSQVPMIAHLKKAPQSTTQCVDVETLTPFAWQACQLAKTIPESITNSTDWLD